MLLWSQGRRMSVDIQSWAGLFWSRVVLPKIEFAHLSKSVNITRPILLDHIWSYTLLRFSSRDGVKYDLIVPPNPINLPLSNVSRVNTGPRFQSFPSLDSCTPRTAYESSAKVFINFLKLPVEIQDLIWHYALPNPRTNWCAILLSINLDLASPSTILPSISEYQQRIESYVDTSLELADAWNTIISVIHACRNSNG